MPYSLEYPLCDYLHVMALVQNKLFWLEYVNKSSQKVYFSDKVLFKYHRELISGAPKLTTATAGTALTNIHA